MQELNLRSKNRIKIVPEQIGALINLQKLILDKNCIKSMPRSINCLTLLSELWLGDNAIGDLPDLRNMMNLKVCVLNNNRLNVIPRSLCHLYGLRNCCCAIMQSKKFQNG